jgi:hypothetical protein
MTHLPSAPSRVLLLASSGFGKAPPHLPPAVLQLLQCRALSLSSILELEQRSSPTALLLFAGDWRGTGWVGRGGHTTRAGKQVPLHSSSSSMRLFFSIIIEKVGIVPVAVDCISSRISPLLLLSPDDCSVVHCSSRNGNGSVQLRSCTSSCLRHWFHGGYCL